MKIANASCFQNFDARIDGSFAPSGHFDIKRMKKAYICPEATFSLSFLAGWINSWRCKILERAGLLQKDLVVETTGKIIRPPKILKRTRPLIRSENGVEGPERFSLCARDLCPVLDLEWPRQRSGWTLHHLCWLLEFSGLFPQVPAEEISADKQVSRVNYFVETIWDTHFLVVYVFRLFEKLRRSKNVSFAPSWKCSVIENCPEHCIDL